MSVEPGAGAEALPVMGFIGWGEESEAMYAHFFSRPALRGHQPWIFSGAGSGPPPSDCRKAATVESLFSEANLLFLGEDAGALRPHLHTMRLAIADRHVVVALGNQWRLAELLAVFHERKVARCRLLSRREHPWQALAYFLAPFFDAEEKAAFGRWFREVDWSLELREEAHFDVLRALTGFAPAAMHAVLESLADGVLMMGIPRFEALRLLAALVQNAMGQVLSGAVPLHQLREEALGDEVAAAGLMTLEMAGIRGDMMRAVHQAVQQARRKHPGDRLEKDDLENV